MSAERKPQTEPSLLSGPLGLLTALVVRFPVPTVALAVAAALFALGLSGSQLGFRTSRLDLLNRESNYNQLWIEYINEFGDEDDVVVVVEGANRESVVPVLEEISTALHREQRLFHAVLHEVNLSKIRAKGLHYLTPDELLGIERFLDKVEPIVHGQWARLKLGTMAAGMSHRLQQAGADPTAQTEVARLSDSLLDATTGDGQYESPWPEMSGSIATLSELNSEYLLTNEGRLGCVLLRLGADDGRSFAKGTRAINALRDLIDQTEARHPEVNVGLTGLPVMENDEMRASQKSMMQASLLSLVGVVCLFVAGFGGVRHPLLTVGALLLAMAWSFGYITLAVGHLNILSISFGVILIGLGIDFGVHYVARYLQLSAANGPSDETLVQTSRSVGPGILTGALTTAIAFFAAGLTEFTGIAELGVIAGGGILLCCLAALTVLPAMLHLCDKKRSDRILPAPLDVHGVIGPLLAWPRLLFTVALVITALLSVGMVHLRYDYNLLNLQPEGLESVQWERKLLEESDQSVWFALSMAEDREELLRRKAEFLRLDSVERVEEIASMFPTDHQQKRPIIERIYARLEDLPERPPRIPVDLPDELGRTLAGCQAVAAAGPEMARVALQLEQVRAALRRMPLGECYAWMDRYQQCMAGDLLSRLHTLRAIANPEPPQLDDLPEGLVTRFVGQGGQHLLKIYSRGDIWDMAAMERFVGDVRSVDSRATGNPLQTYEASKQMRQSYEQAAWYALAVILVVLMIDFWSGLQPSLSSAPASLLGFLEDTSQAVLASACHTLLALVPLGLGMLQTFGLLGLLDVPLNPANLIVLPLILGIGVDDGVHVIHDFRRQTGRYRMSASTASAVLITSLTTMVGFGSLMIASHQGLQSLGRVLTIGVSCCLFTSLVMLPALLGWMTQHRPILPEEEEIGKTADSSVDTDSSRKVYRHDRAHTDPGGGLHGVPVRRDLQKRVERQK